MNALKVYLPGEPVAQGRGRAFFRPGMKHARVFDPEKSRSWKGAAQVHYQEALERAGASAPFFAEGALELVVVAVFTCPKSAPKRLSGARRLKAGRPDPDNLAKCVMDAANGILWTDDSQIARLVVEKWIGAAGEAPRVELLVRALEPQPVVAQARELFEEARA